MCPWDNYFVYIPEKGYRMNILVILLIIVAMGGVVFAVARGLHAFANMQPGDVDENGIPKSLARQNKMMFSRVKWQAIAVIGLILLVMLSQAK
jgi:Hypoxia induced protein conserved region